MSTNSETGNFRFGIIYSDYGVTLKMIREFMAGAADKRAKMAIIIEDGEADDALMMMSVAVDGYPFIARRMAAPACVTRYQAFYRAYESLAIR